MDVINPVKEIITLVVRLLIAFGNVGRGGD
jgi:hypothetical protein